MSYCECNYLPDNDPLKYLQVMRRNGSVTNIL
jgi:hypothetical protein